MSSLKVWALPLAALLLCGCHGAPGRTVISASHTAAPSPTASSPAPLPSPPAKPKPVTVRAMQRALEDAGYPVGTVDGRNGPRTEQGLCAYRALNGLSGGRSPATAAQRRRALQALRLPQPTASLPRAVWGKARAIVVNQTCQTAFLVLGGRVVKVIPVSTGGHYQFFDQYNGQYEWADTPRGLFRLTWKQPGKVTSNEVNGVMYYPWFFHGGAAVHGEADPSAVPPYPASHGCVRMQMPDILFIWKHYQKNDPVLVYGTY